MEFLKEEDDKMDELIKNIKEYAVNNNVPIMTDDGINFLVDYIKKNNIKRILEVGTAIGYSAIMMCNIDKDITVTTIERDKVRYDEAVKNVDLFNYNNRIDLIFGDALEVEIEGKYDLIFIDAAKAQNIKFFEKYKVNLDEDGTIITDNMNFHGLTLMEDTTNLSRNLKQLVRKLNNYHEFLKNNEEFSTEFFDIGDGVAISRRKV